MCQAEFSAAVLSAFFKNLNNSDSPVLQDHEQGPYGNQPIYTPAWYSSTAREERALPLAPGDYKVALGHGAERWTVTCLKDGATVYSGSGPVEVGRAAAAG